MISRRIFVFSCFQCRGALPYMFTILRRVGVEGSARVKSVRLICPLFPAPSHRTPYYAPAPPDAIFVRTTDNLQEACSNTCLRRTSSGSAWNGAGEPQSLPGADVFFSPDFDACYIRGLQLGAAFRVMVAFFLP